MCVRVSVCLCVCVSVYLHVCVTEKGAEIQATLAEMTGQKTVPNVFIGGQHVGESLFRDVDDDVFDMYSSHVCELLVINDIADHPLC